MLADGRVFFQAQPQLMLYPDLCITIVVMGVNIIGDGLRDRFDPRIRKAYAMP